MICDNFQCHECGGEVTCEQVLMCPKGHRDDFLFCSQSCLDHYIHACHDI
ncbi:MAG: hypothetical protein ACTSRK_11160 [Promethearchaeota archaeon]